MPQESTKSGWKDDPLILNIGASSDCWNDPFAVEHGKLRVVKTTLEKEVKSLTHSKEQVTVWLPIWEAYEFPVENTISLLEKSRLAWMLNFFHDKIVFLQTLILFPFSS